MWQRQESWQHHGTTRHHVRMQNLQIGFILENDIWRMYSFKVIRLDIFQSYFFGEVEFRADRFKANIQNQRRSKVLKLPFRIDLQEGKKILVRMVGGRHPEELFVEDYLVYRGQSEWLEIDSDEITFFLADHQDQLDTIEIVQ